MELDLAGMAVDVVRAESSRFRHPLLLLHGLWTGGWIWRDVAPYLAHRGWDVWVPSFVAMNARAMDLAARRAALHSLWRELPAAPVVVTHDAGLAVADAVAGNAQCPALVAIAPLVARAGTLAGPRFWPVRLGARDCPPPGGRSARVLLAGLASDDAARVAVESGSLLRAVMSGGRRGSGIEHGLVVASRHDPAAPLSRCEGLARERGWALEMHDTAGHFPMIGAGATTLADRVHRWLVRALGHELLAWIEDENEGQ